MPRQWKDTERLAACLAYLEVSEKGPAASLEQDVDEAYPAQLQYVHDNVKAFVPSRHRWDKKWYIYTLEAAKTRRCGKNTFVDTELPSASMGAVDGTLAGDFREPGDGIPGREIKAGPSCVWWRDAVLGPEVASPGGEPSLPGVPGISGCGGKGCVCAARACSARAITLSTSSKQASRLRAGSFLHGARISQHS